MIGVFPFKSLRNTSRGVSPVIPAIIENVFSNLGGQGTTSSTTAILKYGMNVFTVATPGNYACKLPQPITGGVVTIINKSNVALLLFPSNLGGKINNYAFNTPAIIPPDSKVYEFICTKNPLPGEWSWNAPATAQLEFNMSVSHTNGVATNLYGINAEMYSLAINYVVNSGSGGIMTVNQPSARFSLPVVAKSTRAKYYTNIIKNDIPLNKRIIVERMSTYMTSISPSHDMSSLGAIEYFTFLNDFTPLDDYPYVDEWDISKEITIGTLSSSPQIGDVGTFYTTFNTPMFNHIGTNMGLANDGAISAFSNTYHIGIDASCKTKVYKFKIIVEYY